MTTHVAKIDMLKLREALEASWDSKTSYQNVSKKDNPAYAQCYPTAWVIQFFFPETEIIEGQVWTGKSMEKHFWNVIKIRGMLYHIDFTWQQFPAGSSVSSYKIRDRKTLRDGRETIVRCELLRKRVMKYLAKKQVLNLV